MKYLFVCCAILIFLCSLQPLHAQKKKGKDEAEAFYLFKQDWSNARNLASAAYFMQVLKENDTTYTCRYYHKEGPMVRQEVFKDADLSIPHGRFCWYNAKGNLDSTGSVYTGKKNGYWNYYNDSNKVRLSILYRMGRVMEKRDHMLNVYTDSSGNTSDLKEKEREEQEVFLADSIAGRVQRATFGKKNGPKEWAHYLKKSVNTPERWANIIKNGCCTVISSFLIDTLGNIAEVYLERSCEWSADAEMINAFQKGPKWNPAVRNGKPVVYRQKQAVTFCVSTEGVIINQL